MVKSSAADKAAKKLKELLFSGGFAVGDKLPGENKLASEFGVSRSTLREALRQLASSGYIKIIPNKGAVAQATNELPIPHGREWLMVNRDTVDDLLVVRCAVEPLAAELCAANATGDVLAKLNDILTRLEALSGTEDTESSAALDLEFHLTVLRASKNRYLEQMYRPLIQGFMGYSKNSSTAQKTDSTTAAEHRAILNAIASHSPAEARYAMALHLTVARRQIQML